VLEHRHLDGQQLVPLEAEQRALTLQAGHDDVGVEVLDVLSSRF
jgi:hypothetical protein